MAGKNGGARPGAGRPQGTLTKTSRDDAVDATKAVNLTPIMVMAHNMRFWYDASIAMTDKINTILDGVADGSITADEETLKDLNGALKRMLFAREQAQSCAADMAPYRHPRLASIEVTPQFGDEPESEAPKITKHSNPLEAAAAYERVLRGGV